MREYLEWERGRTRVRVHRRVLAGLGREAGPVAGLVFGRVSPSEVSIEDYATGSERAGGPLEPVGYFRVIDGPEDIESEPGFGLLDVLIVFRRGAEGVTLEQLYVKPAGAGPARAHRVLYRAETQADEQPDEQQSWRRFLWPAAAVASGLVLGAVTYLWMSSGVRHAAPESAQERPADPMPAPMPAPPPAPKQQTAPLPESSADRSIEPAKPLSRAERSAIQREVRQTLDRWSQSLLRGDADAHASFYAESVGPYFTKSRVSRAEVANEVRAMLKKYGPMRAHRLSSVTIAPTDANHAVANFRKYWMTDGRRFAGEEREQLKFVREGSDWRIASEQELQVYWVRRK